MRKLLLFLFVCLSVLSLKAERVNLHTAQQIAENVMVGSYTLRVYKPEELSLAYVAYSDGDTSVLRSTTEAVDVDFYVFNVNKDAGFVIVAGDNRVRPVLGYATEGNFNKANIPDNMEVWLKHYQEEIKHAVERNLTVTDLVKEEWSTYLRNSVNITPKVLLKTALWGQDSPFNQQCPTIAGQRAKTGSVATAQAIVMKYHQYPKRAQGGVASYMDIPVTYADYDWNETLMDYKDTEPGHHLYYTGYEADLVATLIWHCGANIKMAYGVEESFSSLANSVASLQNVFGYSKQIRYISKKAPAGEDAYSWADWMKILREELDNKRIVLYDGETKEKIDPLHGKGHAFVCDGYADEDLFHINWGWKGSPNGYFLLTALDPQGDNKGYNEQQGMVINIQPKDESLNGALKYQITGKNTVSVIAPNTLSPETWTVTDCIIPETVEIEDKTYRVTGIGTEAFANCQSLVSITFPSGLSMIGERAFVGCSDFLKSIHCLNPEPTAFPLLFFSATMEEQQARPHIYNCILYVPEGSKKRYSQADGWKNFGGIMVEGEIIEPVTEEVTDSTIIVTWNTFDQATGYLLKVYENVEKTKLKAEYTFDADGQLRSSALSFNIKGLQAGYTYYIETLAMREGYFPMPIILSQNTIEVKTTDTATDITDISNDKPVIYGGNGIIHISSKAPIKVNIFDLSGTCVWSKMVNGYEQIQLPRKAYVVNVFDLEYNVFVRNQIIVI